MRFCVYESNREIGEASVIVPAFFKKSDLYTILYTTPAKKRAIMFFVNNIGV